MNDAYLSAGAPVRAEENQQTTQTSKDAHLLKVEEALGELGREIESQDATLEAAVRIVGEHPEEAERLAQELGLQSGGRKAHGDSALKQALRGEAFPPPIYDNNWDAPPAGSFDSAVTEVMGEDEYFNLLRDSLAPSGKPWQFRDEDRLEAVRNQVLESYSFARYAGVLQTAMKDPDENERVEGYSVRAVANGRGSLSGRLVCGAAICRGRASAALLIRRRFAGAAGRPLDHPHSRWRC